MRQDLAAARKEAGGSFIDQVLRTRVETDIASFLGAFDAALAEDTQENRSALRDATDRLLRAGARTRIELERLEARVPLTAHEPRRRRLAAGGSADRLVARNGATCAATAKRNKSKKKGAFLRRPSRCRGRWDYGRLPGVLAERHTDIAGSTVSVQQQQRVLLR